MMWALTGSWGLEGPQPRVSSAGFALASTAPPASAAASGPIPSFERRDHWERKHPKPHNADSPYLGSMVRDSIDSIAMQASAPTQTSLETVRVSNAQPTTTSPSTPEPEVPDAPTVNHPAITAPRPPPAPPVPTVPILKVLGPPSSNPLLSPDDKAIIADVKEAAEQAISEAQDDSNGFNLTQTYSEEWDTHSREWTHLTSPQSGPHPRPASPASSPPSLPARSALPPPYKPAHPIIQYMLPCPTSPYANYTPSTPLHPYLPTCAWFAARCPPGKPFTVFPSGPSYLWDYNCFTQTFEQATRTGGMSLFGETSFEKFLVRHTLKDEMSMRMLGPVEVGDWMGWEYDEGGYLEGYRWLKGVAIGYPHPWGMVGKSPGVGGWEIEGKGED